MGLLLRKTIKVGPVRVNFSNSGISYSAGIKGARISTGTKGTYVTIGSNGIYYRQKMGGTVNQSPTPILAGPLSTHSITSAHIDQLTDVDSKAFIDELNEKATKISLVTWFGLLPLALFILLLSINSFNSRDTVIQQGGSRAVATIESSVGANVRSGPDGDSKVLRAASYAEEFTLLDSTDKRWLKIQFHDSIGYVSKKLAQVGVSEVPREVRTDLHSNNPYFLWILGLGVIIFAILIYFLSLQDRKRLEMEIQYEMDDQMSTFYKTFASHFLSFNSSHRKWQYLHSQRNDDWKRNAGAGTLINRTPIAAVYVHKNPINYFKTNIEIPYIKLKNTELFFLPERLLIRRGDKFAAVFYKNLSLQNSTTRFIEDGGVAADAKIVDYTWRYVNKNGGPDKRFNNNNRIPICQYSLYTIRSNSGIYETICTSRIGAFDGCSVYLTQLSKLQAAMHNGAAIN